MTTAVGEASAARGLLDREQLLQLLDRAVTKRATVISAPPGSGNTSLLRAWAERSADSRHVAFVSVEREQENAQRFWCAVLDAIGGSPGAADHKTNTRTATALDGAALVEMVRFEVAEQAQPLVLIIDDLH